MNFPNEKLTGTPSADTCPHDELYAWDMYDKQWDYKCSNEKCKQIFRVKMI